MNHLTARDVTDKYYPTRKPQWILTATTTLSRDESKDVRAFVAATLQPTKPTLNDVRGFTSDSMAKPETTEQHTFSRPPPPSATESIEVDVPPIEFKPTQNWDGCNHADAMPSPKSSLSTLTNGCDHETKPMTSKTKDGGRPVLSPRTKNGRVSR